MVNGIRKGARCDQIRCWVRLHRVLDAIAQSAKCDLAECFTLYDRVKHVARSYQAPYLIPSSTLCDPIKHLGLFTTIGVETPPGPPPVCPNQDVRRAGGRRCRL